MATVCAEGGGHERLSCGSCHSAWAPRCVTCHTAYDPKGEGYDALEDKDVVGAWTERAGPFVANPPTLGLRRSATPGGRESIDAFAPGMIMTVDRAMQAGAAPDVLFWRLFARVEPHTTRREARSCKSCHNEFAPGTGACHCKPAKVAHTSEHGHCRHWHLLISRLYCKNPLFCEFQS